MRNSKQRGSFKGDAILVVLVAVTLLIVLYSMSQMGQP